VELWLVVGFVAGQA